ncbi:MAG: hypothetical protein BWY80_00253 [Firmicutes bacterium ADurb.Bin456]|nr:MAG: hypothetical protein BWY80_00253 [Firmicutes bacterium ADurb.Bin456]
MDAASGVKKLSGQGPEPTRDSTGSSLLEQKVKGEVRAARLARRDKQEQEREDTESLKELAKYETILAENFIRECKNILRDNLGAGEFDWVSCYRDRPYPPFVFKEPIPRYEPVAREMGMIRKDTVKEFFFPSQKKRRLEMEKEARQVLELKLAEYRQREEAARAADELERESFIARQAQYNNSIDLLRLDLAKGQPGAVESFARTVLALMKYPDALEVEFDARYEQGDRLLVVEAVFPLPQVIPRAVHHQYHEEQGLTVQEMDDREFADFYQEILLQLSLSAIHLVFLKCPDRLLQQVGFNGRVGAAGTEAVSGELQPCIITCLVTRDRYLSVDLSSIPSHTAFLNFNGTMFTPLIALKPVDPIRRVRPTPAPYPDEPTIGYPILRLPRPGRRPTSQGN